MRRLFAIALLAVFNCVLVAEQPRLPVQTEPVDFQRDIRPILSDACYHCHGPDEASREAGLRLDREPDAALLTRHDETESELLLRIRSTDPDEMMPPPDSGKSLSKEQVELLRRWLQAGAKWETHWAFTAPAKAMQPEELSKNRWVRKPFDAFVLERLNKESLRPSEPASRQTLIRRLSFDLTGLPPNWDEVSSFVKDDRPDAYERVVDRLLSSKHFGERMANDWLDAARYADTDGYQADSTRTNWPWRDWVVRSFNENMPFDQFTIEQFAGDLLPDATADQVLATCFHRNHMTNGEGGRDPEESRVEYVIDRVNTMGTVWLGLTLGCTQCHSHKYDPISHAEYYQLNAFFNSIDEDGKAGGGAKPFQEYTSEQMLESVTAGIEDSEAWLVQTKAQKAAAEARALEGFDRWLATQRQRIDRSKAGEFSSWVRPNVSSLEATHGAKLEQHTSGEIRVTGENARHEDYRITTSPKFHRITGMRLVILPMIETGRVSLADDGHFILTNMKLNVSKKGSSQVREISVASAVADYEKEKTGRSYGPIKTVLDDDPRSGWTSMGADPTEQRTAIFGFDEPLELEDGEFVAIEFRHRSLAGKMNPRRFVIEFTDEVGPTLKALKQTPLEKLATSEFEKLDESVQADLREQFLVDRSEVVAARRDVEQANSRHSGYKNAKKPVKVMVLHDRGELRKTHVLERGVWDNKGVEVSRAVPAVLHKLQSADDTPSRLDLARWLVDSNNPLTARVTVNRLWQMLFGYGLVRTPGDFGTQGEPPTHPLVLDWLARDFMESGWDIKHTIKQIVTSSTYQQSSDVTASLLARDPENRLLARNARFRLPSWMIRDAALKSSELLDARLGGPPVYPHQPAGAWADSTMGRFHYKPSVGGDLYRRSLYSFWRRSVAPTGFFDASKRRSCEVRQIRTNTPLHALNLLNDETYVESARVLASLAIAEHESAALRIRFLARRVLAREPSVDEIAILNKQLLSVAREFDANEKAADDLLAIGQSKPGNDVRATELAAWTTVASSILNLDEAMTRE